MSDATPFLANQFARSNGAATAFVFFDLFAGANTWTATQTFANINPNADDTRVAGTNALRWSEVAARRMRAFDTSGAGTKTITQAAGTSGILAGFALANLGATAEIALSQTSPDFRPALVAGSAYASISGGSARLRNQEGGCTVIGSAFSAGTGAALLETIPGGFGAFCGGYAYSTGSNGAATVRSGASGAFCWGYAIGPASPGTGNVIASGAGSVVLGRTEGGGSTGSQTVESTAGGSGSFVSGVVGSGGIAAGLIRASASGAFCQGRSTGGSNATAGGTLLASGSGAFAQGICAGGSAAAATGTITASGSGSFAHGSAVAGALAAAITASGLGSFAVGAATSGQTIAATVANAFQFGVGTNSQIDSLQVGTTVRLKGTVGAPTTPQNGDIFVDANGMMNVGTAGMIHTVGPSLGMTILTVRAWNLL